MSRIERERIVVTTVVELGPAQAFRLFTEEIDRWWKRTPRYRWAPGQSGTLSFEGTPPERLIERGSGSFHVVGRVLAWEPGQRVAFEWSDAEIATDDRTEVDVRFEPHPKGTRITLEHRGLGDLPAAHPARRGFQGEAFEAMFGYFWAFLLTSYRFGATPAGAALGRSPT
jgi:uncharacterized protein YndB with AHSA1/START domain